MEFLSWTNWFYDLLLKEMIIQLLSISFTAEKGCKILLNILTKKQNASKRSKIPNVFEKIYALVFKLKLSL